MYLTSTLLSVAFFHDPFSIRQLVRLLVIIAGVLIVIHSSVPNEKGTNTDVFEAAVEYLVGFTKTAGVSEPRIAGIIKSGLRKGKVKF